jgi:uncharacterized protein YbjT (DUF2867 family)
MKIEIEHEGFCLGATGGTGRLIVRDALAKGHSVVVQVRSKARAPDPTPPRVVPVGAQGPTTRAAPTLVRALRVAHGSLLMHYRDIPLDRGPAS